MAHGYRQSPLGWQLEKPFGFMVGFFFLFFLIDGETLLIVQCRI